MSVEMEGKATYHIGWLYMLRLSAVVVFYLFATIFYTVETDKLVVVFAFMAFASGATAVAAIVVRYVVTPMTCIC